jgi:hypothetical protein
MSKHVILGLVVLACALVRPAAAQRVPLNNAEVDELRDAAQDPEKRIPLYVKHIKARVATLEELRNDPRFDAHRAARIHDLLEEIDNLADELDDNIGVYAKRRFDLRKPLKEVISMAEELTPKLRAMKEKDTAEQARSYGFALDNAIDSLQANLDGARQLLQEQEEIVKRAQDAQKNAPKK